VGQEIAGGGTQGVRDECGDPVQDLATVVPAVLVARITAQNNAGWNFFTRSCATRVMANRVMNSNELPK
jgi:hypothetical protein